MFALTLFELIVLFNLAVIGLCLLGPWAVRHHKRALQLEADRLARVAAFREVERAEQAAADARDLLREQVNEHLDKLWKQRHAKEMA